MVIRLKSFKEFDESINRIEVWYDHYEKVWTVQKMNRSGDVIGDTIHEYRKGDATKIARELGKEHNVEVKIEKRTR